MRYEVLKRERHSQLRDEERPSLVVGRLQGLFSTSSTLAMSKVTTAKKGAPQTKKTATTIGRKKEKSVKPPLSTEERQKRCFASLCDQLEGDHLENAIRTKNKRMYSSFIDLDDGLNVGSIGS